MHDVYCFGFDRTNKRIGYVLFWDISLSPRNVTRCHSHRIIARIKSPFAFSPSKKMQQERNTNQDKSPAKNGFRIVKGTERDAIVARYEAQMARKAKAEAEAKALQKSGKKPVE